MSMSDGELEAIVKNETEWRKMLWKKVESLESELDDIRISNVEFQKSMLVTMTTLKIKYGFMASIFGIIGGGITTVFLFWRK